LGFRFDGSPSKRSPLAGEKWKLKKEIL